MIVAACWAALFLVALCLELAARSARRFSTLGAVAAGLASRRLGLLLLFALWAFTGWHLFARYTLHRL